MRILDLFCGAGGAAMGYSRAGFEVVGVDIEPMPRYPFAFYQSNALSALADGIATGGRLGIKFDAIHASPPCQASSLITKGTNRIAKSASHVDLIAATRELLKLTGLPYVIENVQGAKVRRDLTLCGEMFGLGVIRHRWFELGGWIIEKPEHIKHRGRVAGMRHGEWFTGPYFQVYGDGGGKGTVEQWQQAMGIDWTDDRKEIAESIPPAYSQFVGERLMVHLLEARAAA